MATDLALTAAWSDPITTTADTVVQALNGSVRVTSQATPANAQGILLSPGDVLPIKSGVTFRARSAGGNGVLLVMEEL